MAGPRSPHDRQPSRTWRIRELSARRAVQRRQPPDRPPPSSRLAGVPDRAGADLGGEQAAVPPPTLAEGRARLPLGLRESSPPLERARPGDLTRAAAPPGAD